MDISCDVQYSYKIVQQIAELFSIATQPIQSITPTRPLDGVFCHVFNLISIFIEIRPLGMWHQQRRGGLRLELVLSLLVRFAKVHHQLNSCMSIVLYWPLQMDNDFD